MGMHKLRIELQRNMHLEHHSMQEILASTFHRFMQIVIAFWVDSRSQLRTAIRIIPLIMELNIARANKRIIHRIIIRIHIAIMARNNELTKILATKTKIPNTTTTTITAIQSTTITITNSINLLHRLNANSTDCSAWNRHNYSEKFYPNLTKKSLNLKRWLAT